ncbi:hypothetical protein chiPu_0006114 [Chiloscyllium punctatum]|uniref:PLAT domain-containing protein n=1 Tax=Chiloscyllium punctatum TaxID=137246 RepID=A0A401SBA6_CHIPU|nr:hypothetical protein [Chiloscyllium punctatum]
MKDRQDLMKVKKTVLADNDPFAKYHYLVKVFTGHRRGAGTTSKVVMMLYGSAGQSDSHHLTDPKKPVFQQGSVDEFLLATPFPLGNLTSIRLNLFFIKTSESFTDQHIWFSIFARPPRSSFTRVQRVSCCFSLLLCTMLTNIMFWGTADNGTEQEEQLDDHIIGLREVIIGIESALIIFPVNLIIVQIFRNTHPKSTDISATLNKSASDDPSECQRTPENIMMVLFVAAFIALIVKKVERNENEESYNENLLSTINEDLNVVTPNYTKRSDAGIYKPPSVKHVEKMKAQHLKEKKMYDFIKDIFAHVGFLVVLAIIAYGERSPHSFYLNKALNDSFTRKFNGSLAVNDFYIWANEILLPNLYGPYEGFITDGNSKLLGSPRIRQVRIKPTPCPVPTRLVDSIQECRAPYSYGDEDMLDFGSKGNFSVNTESLWLASAWHYQSESQLKGYPVWGKIALYRGGGFVAELGTENKTADRIINYLKENTWVDMYTRAIFVEFTVYNANVNLFCVVTLMLEMNAIGVFLGNMQMEIIRLYHYVDQNYSSIIGAQVVFIIIVIYYMVKQCYLVLGLYLSSYRTFSTAVITIIHLLLGAFNYNEVLQTYPFLGAIIISTCVIIMTFILINIFISALLMSFSEERHHPMPSEDEEIIDLLLVKLCNIIGIQRKGKEEPPSNAEEMAFVQEK